MITLTEQFLAWVANAPRTYADAMEAWRTSCPRLTIWEDALRDGLVAIERAGNGSMREAGVALTAKGRALLDGPDRASRQLDGQGHVAQAATRRQADAHIAPRNVTGSDAKPRNRARPLRIGAPSSA